MVLTLEYREDNVNKLGQYQIKSAQFFNTVHQKQENVFDYTVQGTTMSRITVQQKNKAQ